MSALLWPGDRIHHIEDATDTGTIEKIFPMTKRALVRWDDKSGLTKTGLHRLVLIPQVATDAQLDEVMDDAEDVAFLSGPRGFKRV